MFLVWSSFYWNIIKIYVDEQSHLFSQQDYFMCRFSRVWVKWHFPLKRPFWHSFIWRYHDEHLIYLRQMISFLIFLQNLSWFSEVFIVRMFWLVGRTLSFFKGVHCEANEVLNMFAFAFISVSKLSFIKGLS